VTFVALRRRS